MYIMLPCNFCRKTILESGNPWDYHQKSYRGLKESTDKLCVFCVSLRKDVDVFCKAELEWPLYRWSVRKLGHIREKGNAVVVTFRPLPHVREEFDAKVRDENNEQQRRVGRGAIPERMFYLFPEEGNPLHDFASRLRAKVLLTDRDGYQILDTYPQSSSSERLRIPSFQTPKSKSGYCSVHKITKPVDSGNNPVATNFCPHDCLPWAARTIDTYVWLRRNKPT